MQKEHCSNIVRVPIGEQTYFMTCCYDGTGLTDHRQLIAVREVGGEVSLGVASTTAGFGHPDHPHVRPVLDWTKSMHAIQRVGMDGDSYLHIQFREGRATKKFWFGYGPSSRHVLCAKWLSLLFWLSGQGRGPGDSAPRAAGQSLPDIDFLSLGWWRKHAVEGGEGVEGRMTMTPKHILQR